jgi:hypothetical protein
MAIFNSFLYVYQRVAPKAGTTVLQTVDDETWAMATHTGIHTQSHGHPKHIGKW